MSGITKLSDWLDDGTYLETKNTRQVNLLANNIQETATDRLWLSNETAADVTLDQFSPALRFHGEGWKTTAPAGSQPFDWRIYATASQAATNPATNLNMDFSINNGAWATIFSLGVSEGVKSVVFTNVLTMKIFQFHIGYAATYFGMAGYGHFTQGEPNNIMSTLSDGATAKAVKMGSYNAYTTVGAKLAAFMNSSVEKASISKDGAFGSAIGAVTLGAGIATFASAGNAMVITGDADGNTVTTITAGVTGQTLRLIFVDALVTITDDNSHAANTIDLSAAFTSADDTILTLWFDGTSWYEVSRSAN